MKCLSNIIHEPLLHFFVIAGLIFLADSYFSNLVFLTNSNYSNDDSSAVVVDLPTQKLLLQQREELLARPLTPVEQKEVVETFVNDELLLRAAYELGLDKSIRIRQQLLNNMRILLSNKFKEPTEKELREYFITNLDQFIKPPSASYQHVFYSEVSKMPPNVLDQLQSGIEVDDLPAVNRQASRVISQINLSRLSDFIGETNADEIWKISDIKWHGPYQSQHGAHFIKLTNRISEIKPAYEEVSRYVHDRWVFNQRELILEEELAKLRTKYPVTIHPLNAS